ncbi:hypothetical protein GMORB2_1644 [Geosmithia morbida]|uniref:F-box domain-containing protein n=1 Tax=Geosmithia morbida TaxID=1094350 RepID=A0A9P5D3H8_9HYPO|nr:uncharacterized protein GMORB2_1644 [Geosmithia morbida]KAF4121805.1 hypothetical protein GMORB2_1644 [Geosmithia morbida]
MVDDRLGLESAADNRREPGSRTPVQGLGTDPQEAGDDHGTPPRPTKRCRTMAGGDEDCNASSEAPGKRSWLEGAIPVEIFGIITSYLTRADVRNLRLVCQEFDRQVSVKYFRSVVVPFRSELYGKQHPQNGIARPSNSLFYDGMRIFQTFGPHILRFALSLEIDYSSLAYPPVKLTQEIVPSFWGIYRWPHGSYSRYLDLEGIEETADETLGMKEALRCLTTVTNLGLYCDAGLGCIGSHQDYVRAAASRAGRTQHPTFASFAPAENEPGSRDRRDTVTVSNANLLRRASRDDTNGIAQHNYTILKRMACGAGYRDAQADEAIRLLLNTEGIDIEALYLSTDPFPSSNPGDYDTGYRRGQSQGEDPRAVLDLEAFHEHGFLPADPPAAPNIPQHQHQQLDQQLQAQLPMNLRFNTLFSAPSSPRATATPLTQAQKELLLELGWAHRAMIQSYVISMIDNSRAGLLDNLTTLTIAKIPSCHLNILYNDHLWQNIPSLSNVSLAVIADWRKISKRHDSTIEDAPVFPVEAVPGVYKLLNEYISRQPGIKSLHFEWICGGEFGLGAYQRNQHVLPAPFFADPQDMVSATGVLESLERLLRLPHIQHLSLNNCWISPQVFLQMMRQMGLSSLEKLALESVSLTGPPSLTPQVWYANPRNLPGLLLNNPPLPAPMEHVPLGYPAEGTMPYEQGDQVHGGGGPVESVEQTQSPFPYWFLWSALLEHFSPRRRDHLRSRFRGNATTATSAAETHDQWWERSRIMSFSRRFVPCASQLGRDELHYRIKNISVKSCGYIGVDARHVLTRSLLPRNIYHLPEESRSGVYRAINDMVLRPQDKLLGCIIPYIQPSEVISLTELGMIFGWTGVYSRAMVDEAVDDDILRPGSGRFTGVLETTGT